MNFPCLREKKNPATDDYQWLPMTSFTVGKKDPTHLILWSKCLKKTKQKKCQLRWYCSTMRNTKGNIIPYLELISVVLVKGFYAFCLVFGFRIYSFWFCNNYSFQLQTLLLKVFTYIYQREKVVFCFSILLGYF